MVARFERRRSQALSFALPAEVSRDASLFALDTSAGNASFAAMGFGGAAERRGMDILASMAILDFEARRRWCVWRPRSRSRSSYTLVAVCASEEAAKLIASVWPTYVASRTRPGAGLRDR